MEKEIQYLQQKYPEALVWKSLDKDYINVRHSSNSSLFYTDKNEKFKVAITDTQKYHVDTIRLEMVKPKHKNPLKMYRKPLKTK